jgi:hypothetical protein
MGISPLESVGPYFKRKSTRVERFHNVNDFNDLK